MSAQLTQNSYGKSDVRVTKVIRRHDGRHDLVEISIDVQLMGDFAETYLTGDNSKVVATDTMKNTVYVLAKTHPLESIESFAVDLSKHFVESYEHVATARVQIHQTGWGRIKVNNQPHPHSFVSCGNERRTCTAEFSGKRTTVTGGLRDLLVLKTTDSAFAGFVRDKLTTLKDTDDRIFATSVTASWDYSSSSLDYNDASETIRTALLETFAQHRSLSVQQTLYAMGDAALERCPAISRIHLHMPNKHRILVNLQPFGLENQNEIFVWTDEPYGEIHGTVERR